ncbi:MAG: AAA family ATPase [Ruminococcaceae bacterium]|nr:AAA family ATPase [Oscillospiraceae bacterium]
MKNQERHGSFNIDDLIKRIDKKLEALDDDIEEEEQTEFELSFERRMAEKQKIEERVKKHLSPKQYAEWTENRMKPWAKIVESIPFGQYRTPYITLKGISEEFDRNIIGREAEKAEMLRKTASFIVNGRFRRPLLFVGAPGEGKSCFAKCLASALGYPIRYINVPSLNSPIALCGSERHYENSRIGGLLQSVIEEEALSVVFVFDEIDKAVTDSSDGSVEAALLALFDPMWNGAFTDRSVGVAVDFSRSIFICTANDLSSISEPMRDRMDIIRFEPYTSEQALSIVENMTIPRAIESSGVQGRVRFAPEVAGEVIRRVGEGSMRDYEKMIEQLVDHAIYMLLSKGRKRYTVTVEDLDKVWPSKKTNPLGFSA